MNRRQAVGAIGGLIVSARASARPERMKPQVGDTLVHAFGDLAGQLVDPETLVEQRVFAFPRSPEGVIRDGSLHNQVSVLRVDESALSDKTKRYAAGAIIAVSAACTHTGCEVSGWDAEAVELVCPCHGSRFNVLDAARVTLGPATKPLAYLPIAIANGTIKVDGKFSRRVGPAPQF